MLINGTQEQSGTDARHLPVYATHSSVKEQKCMPLSKVTPAMAKFAVAEKNG
jgi:hypothetical protein